MKITDILLNVIFPPECVCCGKGLGIFSDAALCDFCKARFEISKGYICPECRLPHSECLCSTRYLKAFSKKAFHIAEYSSDAPEVRSIILTAKDHNYKYLYDFIANELYFVIKSRLEYEDCVLTFVPRSVKKVVEYGIDQSERSAKLLAKRLGIPFVSLFRHKRALQQKSLSTKERIKNAKHSYELFENKKDFIKGKRFILYDDVVTTGATMAACASLLKSNKAKEIIFLSLGKTYNRLHQGKYKIKL